MRKITRSRAPAILLISARLNAGKVTNEKVNQSIIYPKKILSIRLLNVPAKRRIKATFDRLFDFLFEMK